MTLRKLALLGHPVLLTPAAPLTEVRTTEVQRLIDDMLATMDDARGIGLAAPQVYEPVRIVALRELADRAERAEAPARVLVNPELRPLDEAEAIDWEGCLSIPGIRGRVPRHRRVAYRALDRQGEPVAGEAQGLVARILQHEVDHLDGILFPMRMRDLRQLALTSELALLAQWLEQEGVCP